MSDSKYPRIAGVNFESTVDGVGVRTVIFLSGCSHFCPGCQNASIQDEHAGEECTEELIQEIAKGIASRPFVRGITLSGGDPLYNPAKTFAFLQRLMSVYLDLVEYSTIDVWMYTGYTWEEIIDDLYGSHSFNMLLSLVDVVVDGRFIQAEADKRLRFRGSRNQRIINVIDTASGADIRNPVLWTNRRRK